MINYYLLLLIGTGCIGLTAGLVGSFAYLKNQSLLGDTLSHAAFPGYVGALLLTQSKQPSFLMCGGIVSSATGALLTYLIYRYCSNIKQDTALGIVLPLFFGSGLLLLSLLQRHAIAHQGLLSTLFLGNLSVLLPQDIYWIIGICLAVNFLVWFFWKEFKVVCFDSAFATVSGYATTRWYLGLTSIMVLTIVVTLQATGIVLTSSLLIAPAVAARLTCSRLESMVCTAAALGAGVSIAGVVVSSSVEHLPPGPPIVLLVSGIVLLSFLYKRYRTS